MRQARIFYKDRPAGILTENDAGYEFRYLPEYLSLDTAKAVSLTLPLREEAYTSTVLFPFFDGLIPEGWLLDIVLRNTDISILYPEVLRNNGFACFRLHGGAVGPTCAEDYSGSDILDRCSAEVVFALG